MSDGSELFFFNDSPMIGRSVYHHILSRTTYRPAGIIHFEDFKSQTETMALMAKTTLAKTTLAVMTVTVLVNGLAESYIYSLSSAAIRHIGLMLYVAGSQTMELITKRKLLAKLKVLTRLADILAAVSLSGHWTIGRHYLRWVGKILAGSPGPSYSIKGTRCVSV